MLYTTVLDWLCIEQTSSLQDVALILSMPVPAAVCCKERSVDLELSYVLQKT